VRRGRKDEVLQIGEFYRWPLFRVGLHPLRR
jgi:hypothetical protein